MPLEPLLLKQPARAEREGGEDRVHVSERVPPGDHSSAPLEDYPLAGFCCDPLYWEAIM